MLVQKKFCGETMRQFLDRVSENYDYPITYTGRLDPMAMGEVPLIPKARFRDINEIIKKQHKVYRVRIILGIQTDSDDVLGIIKKLEPKYLRNSIDLKKIIPYFEKSSYQYHQKYHYFSSKRLAKRKRNLDDDCGHDVIINSSKVVSSGTLNFSRWKMNAIMEINNVDKKCNFRQEDIIDTWERMDFDIINYLDVELDVSSGFYVRQFVRDISEELNIPMMAYHINRIKLYESK